MQANVRPPPAQHQPPPQDLNHRPNSGAELTSSPAHAKFKPTTTERSLHIVSGPGPAAHTQPTAPTQPEQAPSRGWGTNDVIPAVRGTTSAPESSGERCVPVPMPPRMPQPKAEPISFTTLLRSARAATSRDSARDIRASRGALPFVAPDLRRALVGKMKGLRQGGPRRDLARVLATVLAHAVWAHLDDVSLAEAWAQMQRKAAESVPSRAPRVQPNGPDGPCRTAPTCTAASSTRTRSLPGPCRRAHTSAEVQIFEPLGKCYAPRAPHAHHYVWLFAYSSGA